jgi:hypothetical protein
MEAFPDPIGMVVVRVVFERRVKDAFCPATVTEERLEKLVPVKVTGVLFAPKIGLISLIEGFKKDKLPAFTVFPRWSITTIETFPEPTGTETFNWVALLLNEALLTPNRTKDVLDRFVPVRVRLVLEGAPICTTVTVGFTYVYGNTAVLFP